MDEQDLTLAFMVLELSPDLSRNSPDSTGFCSEPVEVRRWFGVCSAKLNPVSGCPRALGTSHLLDGEKCTPGGVGDLCKDLLGFSVTTFPWLGYTLTSRCPMF